MRSSPAGTHKSTLIMGSGKWAEKVARIIADDPCITLLGCCSRTPNPNINAPHMSYPPSSDLAHVDTIFSCLPPAPQIAMVNHLSTITNSPNVLILEKPLFTTEDEKELLIDGLRSLTGINTVIHSTFIWDPLFHQLCDNLSKVTKPYIDIIDVGPHAHPWGPILDWGTHVAAGLILFVSKCHIEKGCTTTFKVTLLDRNKTLQLQIIAKNDVIGSAIFGQSSERKSEVNAITENITLKKSGNRSVIKHNNHQRYDDTGTVRAIIHSPHYLARSTNIMLAANDLILLTNKYPNTSLEIRFHQTDNIVFIETPVSKYEILDI